MVDYIKVPTAPKRDLLRGVEELSPSQRIRPRRSGEEGSSQQSGETPERYEGRDPRHFMVLRRLINELQESAEIGRVDFATADTEMRQRGLAIVEQELSPFLLRLQIPFKSIKHLQLQIDAGLASVSVGSGRRIEVGESFLFPLSTMGLLEYNLRFGELKIGLGKFNSGIVEQIDREGFYIVEDKGLRLTFSRLESSTEAVSGQVKLKIGVQLGVVEKDESGRRAILYPKGDNNYGLYSDKPINLSI
jgi:hypothetical protein